MGRSEYRVAGALRCFYAGTPKPFPAAILNWHVIYTAGPFPVEHRKLWLPQKVMTSVRWLAPSSVVLPCTPKPAWSQGALVADQCRRFQFLAGSCVSTRISRRGHTGDQTGHVFIGRLHTVLLCCGGKNPTWPFSDMTHSA